MNFCCNKTGSSAASNDSKTFSSKTHRPNCTPFSSVRNKDFSLSFTTSIPVVEEKEGGREGKGRERGGRGTEKRKVGRNTRKEGGMVEDKEEMGRGRKGREGREYVSERAEKKKRRDNRKKGREGTGWIDKRRGREDNGC